MSGVVHRARWVLPIDGPPIEDGEVAVAGGTVTAVGRDLAATLAAQGFSTLDHDGVLLPGLVNAHAHLVYGPSFADLARGGLPFEQWIAELLPRRRAMTVEQLLADARASARLAVATGTTAVADVVSDLDTLPVLGEAGLRGRGYYEMAGADARVWGERRTVWQEELRRHPDAGVSPHTLYTLGDSVITDLAALARAEGRRLHSHLAETAGESEFVLAGTGPYLAFTQRFGLAMELARRPSGRTPTRHLDALGGLGPDVHVAHGVHVDAADRELLRRRGSAVALCPRSNAILASGRAPVAAYRAERNPVAIGTDSLASTPDLDLLAELRALRRLTRDQGSPADGLERWLVHAVTAGGAYALGIEAGVLAPGARADLVVVEGEGSDPYRQVVDGRAVETYLGGTAVIGLNAGSTGGRVSGPGAR